MYSAATYGTTHIPGGWLRIETADLNWFNGRTVYGSVDKPRVYLLGKLQTAVLPPLAKSGSSCLRLVSRNYSNSGFSKLVGIANSVYAANMVTGHSSLEIRYAIV